MKIIGAFLLVAVDRSQRPSLCELVRDEIAPFPFLLKDSINTFNTKLFKSVAEFESGNIIYSPFFLHMILSLAYVGAPLNSPTSDEMAKLLAFEPTDLNNQAYLHNYLKVIDLLQSLSGIKGTELFAANRLFAAKDRRIKKDFIGMLDKFYNIDIEAVYFERQEQTAAVINEFIQEESHGRIYNIIKPDTIEDFFRFVMISAVYFKGLWKFPFKAEKTETQSFRVDSERTVDFLAMKQTGKLTLARVDQINADVVKIPFANEDLIMIVVVPFDDTDIEEVAKKLESFDIFRINSELGQVIPSEVDLTFPKFEAEFSSNKWGDVLKNLGVETIFDATKANLTNISDKVPFISLIRHTATIKISEDGAKANEATVTNGRLKKAKLVVDRPFIFYIYDVVNQIPLMVGRIVDPNGKLKLRER